MSALSEALLAAQRQALTAMQRHYIAGGYESDDAFRDALNLIGCTDVLEQEYLLSALKTMSGYGVDVNPKLATNGTTTESRPASEAQWKLIRRLADERGQVAPDGPLTVEQASHLIETLKADS